MVGRVKGRNTIMSGQIHGKIPIDRGKPERWNVGENKE